MTPNNKSVVDGFYLGKGMRFQDLCNTFATPRLFNSGKNCLRGLDKPNSNFEGFIFEQDESKNTLHLLESMHFAGELSGSHRNHNDSSNTFCNGDVEHELFL